MIKLQRCIHLPIRGHSYIFKMADCLIFNPVNAFKTTDLKKKIERKTKTAGISIHVIKTTGKLRASIQMFFLLCPAQSIE